MKPTHLLIVAALMLAPFAIKAEDSVSAARAAAATGLFENAIAHWDEALEQGQDPVEVLVGRGESLRMLGLLTQAEADHRRALALAESEGGIRVALTSGVLGTTLLQARRSEEARKMLERSLLASLQAKDDALAAAAALHLGNLYATAQSREAALNAYRQALELAEGSGDPRLKVTAQLNLARIEPLPLPPLLNAARALAQGVERTRLLLAIGQLASERAAGVETQMGLAHQALSEAIEAARRLGQPRLLSEAEGRLATLYASVGRLDEANRLIARALFSAQLAGAGDLGLRWGWQQGRLLAARGDRGAAIGAYRRAVHELEELRSDIPVVFDHGRSSFRDTLEPLYLELADLLISEARAQGEQGEAGQQLLLEARDTVELLKAAELRDYFKDSCTIEPKAVGVDVIERGTALLYPILLNDRLELLLGLDGKLSSTTVAISSAELTRSAERLAGRLRRGGTLRFRTLAEQLHGWLIAPIEPQLRASEVDTLIFVPDGPLRLMPLTALHDGEQFVAERYAVVTAPGLTLLDPHPLPRDELTALVAGITEGVQGFEPLPGVASEIDALDQLLPGRTLVDSEFQLERFRGELGTAPYRVVHVASHGVFAGTAEESFILTYDDRIDMNRLQDLLANERADTPVELLTLSACETAEGDDRAPLGLAGAALRSGARSALGSLWVVSDEAAQRMIPEFYSLLSNNTKAEALRQAQLKLLREPGFEHPFFWSAFILIGNWL